MAEPSRTASGPAHRSAARKTRRAASGISGGANGLPPDRTRRAQARNARNRGMAAGSVTAVISPSSGPEEDSPPSGVRAAARVRKY